MPGHAKSHVVGPATDGQGARTTAYRAVRPHVCIQCAGTITPGALFSRRSRPSAWPAVGTVTTAPVCVGCRPLRVEGATDASAPTEGDHHKR